MTTQQLSGNWDATWLSQRLYRSVYEKNKMKIHTVPDMVEMVTAKDSQKKVSEVDYRLHLHEWICHPDLQVNSHVRKVTDQISDVSPLLRRNPMVAPPSSSFHLRNSRLVWIATLAFVPLAFLSMGLRGLGAVPGSRAEQIPVASQPLSRNFCFSFLPSVIGV